MTPVQTYLLLSGQCSNLSFSQNHHPHLFLFRELEELESIKLAEEAAIAEAERAVAEATALLDFEDEDENKNSTQKSETSSLKSGYSTYSEDQMSSGKSKCSKTNG